MFDSDWQKRKKRRAKPACRVCQLSRIGRGTAVPHIFSLTYGGGTCQGVIQTIPENLWEAQNPHVEILSLPASGASEETGLELGAPSDSHPSDGGDTGGRRGMNTQRIQLINEYGRMP